MSRDFKQAKIEKLIPSNPVQDVGLPLGLKKDKRPFVSLTDAEIEKYAAAPEAKDLETKLASITARTEGGMRTSELLRWDWPMIDTVDFVRCDLRRAKTGEVQIGLEIPGGAAPLSSRVVGPGWQAKRWPRLPVSPRAPSRSGQEGAGILVRSSPAARPLPRWRRASAGRRRPEDEEARFSGALVVTHPATGS